MFETLLFGLSRDLGWDYEVAMHPAVVILFRVLSRVTRAQSQAEWQQFCGTTIELWGPVVKPEYKLRLGG